MLKNFHKNIQKFSAYLLRLIFSNSLYFIWLIFHQQTVLNKNKKKLENIQKKIIGKNVLIGGSGITNINLDEIIKDDKYQVILFINRSIKLAKNISKYECRNKFLIWFTGDFGAYKEMLNHQKIYSNRVDFFILTGLLPWFYPVNIKLLLLFNLLIAL